MECQAKYIGDAATFLPPTFPIPRRCCHPHHNFCPTCGTYVGGTNVGGTNVGGTNVGGTNVGGKNVSGKKVAASPWLMKIRWGRGSYIL